MALDDVGHSTVAPLPLVTFGQQRTRFDGGSAASDPQRLFSPTAEITNLAAWLDDHPDPLCPRSAQWVCHLAEQKGSLAESNGAINDKKDQYRHRDSSKRPPRGVSTRFQSAPPLGQNGSEYDDRRSHRPRSQRSPRRVTPLRHGR
jgi:hypothetical protein